MNTVSNDPTIVALLLTARRTLAASLDETASTAGTDPRLSLIDALLPRDIATGMANETQDMLDHTLDDTLAEAVVRLVALAAELESEVDARHQGRENHPSLQRAYDRDMSSVLETAIFLRGIHRDLARGRGGTSDEPRIGISPERIEAACLAARRWGRERAPSMPAIMGEAMAEIAEKGARAAIAALLSGETAGTDAPASD